MNWLNIIAGNLFKNQQSGINILLRKMGYDAVQTDERGFDDGINSQIVVFNPKAINLITKIDNPLLSRADVKEYVYLGSKKHLKEQERKRQKKFKQEQRWQELDQFWKEENKKLDKMMEDINSMRNTKDKTQFDKYLDMLDLHLKLTKELNLEHKKRRKEIEELELIEKQNDI